MNREAIALAADSAVTLGEGQKTWQSANKIFTLSKYHPIGVMIFGNASFMEIPWETIIKLFRERLGKKELATVEEYEKAFIEFLNTRKDFYPKSAQLKYFREVVGNLLIEIKEEVEERIDDLLEEEIEESENLSGISETEFIDLLNEVIEEYYTAMNKSKFLEGCNKEDAKNTLSLHSDVINSLIDEIFEQVPLTQKYRNRLRKISGGCFYKEFFIDFDALTGVVFAGFGREEIFPGFCRIHLQGFVNNKLPIIERFESRVGFDKGVVVAPFAQREMVDTFMEGVDPDYQEMIESVLDELLDSLPQAILETVNIDIESDTKLQKKISEICEKVSNELKEKMENYREDNFVQAIVWVVEKLPKTELALMAESLVSLTSLKRKVSMQVESVSGPIDVAIISKGDGFIWIKRKHYFNPELNQQFQERYFMEM